MTTKKEIVEDDIFAPNFVDLEVIDVDEESVFVRIQDWRIRVYFEDRTIDPLGYIHKILKIKYNGDLNDVMSLQLLPIKL